MSAVRVVTDQTADDVARRVAGRFLPCLRSDLAERGEAHIAVTGGSMGIAVLREAAACLDAPEIDWSLVHFWWGDDRFVPRDHADRNARQARDALLGSIPVPPENVHEMPAADEGLGLDDAAEAYAAELARFGTDDQPWPSFSLCFLGMGPDGHVASLFPGRAEIEVTDAAVVAVRDSPKPPPTRLTLTLPVINAAERVWLVVAGADKAAALRDAVAGEVSGVPAARVRGLSQTLVFADHPAAAELRTEGDD